MLHVDELTLAYGTTPVLERASLTVETAQVAPTILAALGLDPRSLDAVRLEKTTVLPAAPFGDGATAPVETLFRTPY